MSLVSTNKIENNTYELEIAADAASFESAVNKAYLKNRKKIKVNGFRNGSAPRKMIEKLYGAEVFYEDAVNELIPLVVAPDVEGTNLELVDTPDIKVTAIDKTSGVTFKVTCIVKPEVSIADYKGIEISKAVKAITDEDIDKQIQSLRERNGRMVTIDDRAAEIGDTTVIDFEGFKDGVQFDGGSEKDFELTLGSGQFIPGFEDQIVGKKTNDEFTINVTFPENYQMKELAGQPAEFKIVLHEIRKKELPEVDDDFVKDATDFNTVDEMKADFRKKLEDSAAKNADIEADNTLYESLIGKMTADIPQVMIERKIDDMVRDFEMRLSQQGLNIDTYLTYTNMKMEDFRKTYGDNAEKQVKVRLALEKIAELEKLEISDEKVDEEINRLAQQYNMTADQIKNIVHPSSIKSDLVVAEAAKLVKDSAKIIG